MQTTNNEVIFELLESTNLNWEVSKEPLISQIDGISTPMYGTFKKASRQFLGCVKERYHVYQNWQLAEAILMAAESIGVNFDKGGQLNNGSKVYLQASLPDEYIGKSNVKRKLTALNSHDGSTSIGFGSSNTVVVCQNTFFRAYKDLTKFKHSVKAPEKVKSLAIDMNAAMLADEQLMSNFKVMADTELRDEMIEKVIKKIFSVTGNTSQEEISTRKKNIITSFADALDTEIKLEGKTVWGLFNAVTRYTNHIAAPQEENQKINYLMNGAGYKMSNMTYEILMQEIDKELVLI